MSAPFTPVYSSTKDGSDLTLCKILEAVSTTAAGIAPATTLFKSVSTANTNPNVVKASAGSIFTIALHHNSGGSGGDRYFKFYDKATAPSSSDVPEWTIPISTGTDIIIPFSNGLVFTSGIAFRITANYADNDNTSIAANEVYTNIAYA